MSGDPRLKTWRRLQNRVVRLETLLSRLIPPGPVCTNCQGIGDVPTTEWKDGREVCEDCAGTGVESPIKRPKSLWYPRQRVLLWTKETQDAYRVLDERLTIEGVL